MTDAYDDYDLRVDLLTRKQERVKMTEQRVSKQLAKVVSAPKKEGQRVVFTYDRLDEPKKGMTAGILADGMPEVLKESLKRIQIGDEVVIVKTEGAPDKNGKQWWNLSAIEDKATFVAKEKKPFVGRSFGNQKSTYDDTGVKVGASRNQAIAFLAATQGTKFTLDDVDAVAMEIIDRQAKQEEEVRSSKLTLPKDVATKLKEDVKNAGPIEDDWATDDVDLSVFD
jgi:hypothetical protein